MTLSPNPESPLKKAKSKVNLIGTDNEQSKFNRTQSQRIIAMKDQGPIAVHLFNSFPTEVKLSFSVFARDGRRSGGMDRGSPHVASKSR